MGSVILQTIPIIKPKPASSEIKSTFIQLLQSYASLNERNQYTFLLELIKYIKQDTVTKYWLSDEWLQPLFKIIKLNLFRTLPNSTNYDETEDKSWINLQLIYDILVRFIHTTNLETLQKHIDQTFLSNMIHLMNSPNPFEREYIKQITHAIYRRCIFYRTFIRTEINNYFYCMIYSNIQYNGIEELLQILSSIINGFMMPLKSENISLLKNVLIPMHKVSFVDNFHEQLACCIMQFIQKDSNLTTFIIAELLKYWPVRSAQKQVLFLNELERILLVIKVDQLEKIMIPLFKQIAKCMTSHHSEIAESALFLWINEKMVQFISKHKKDLLPILYPTLHSNYLNHWHENISLAAFKMTLMLNKMDTELFKDVIKSDVYEKRQQICKKHNRISKWNAIREMACENNDKV